MYKEKVIGTIISDNNNGLNIKFNEFDATDLVIVNNLVKDLAFYAPQIDELGTRQISLILNDGGGPNEFGENETVITRNIDLFVGKTGTIGNETIDGTNDIHETLIGGAGVDSLIGGEGDYIDLQLEKEFYDLYSNIIITDPFYNKVNLGIDYNNSSKDLNIIQSKLDEAYNPELAIDFEESYDQSSGLLTISNIIINDNSDNIPSYKLFLLEEMNGYKSETDLFDFISYSGNDIVLDVLGKAKELLVSSKVNSVNYNREIVHILGENQDSIMGNQELSIIINTIKSNLVIKNKISMQENFINTGTMVLNGTDEFDSVEGIKNVKGSEFNDHILGSKENNIIDGKAGDDIIYGGYGNDYILGGDGNDIISSGPGNDFIDAGAGDDIIYVSSGENVKNGEGQTILGGSGFDTLSFENINNGVLLDFVFGMGSLDEVDGTDIANTTGDGLGEVIYFVLEGETYHTFEKIIGSGVNDYIINLTPWDKVVEIFGGHGDDNLFGSYGNEFLSGGMGNDILSGGYGVDILKGGAGFDTFFILDDTPTEEFKKQWILNNPEDEKIINEDNIFKSEDIIKDFVVGVDTLDLTAIVKAGANLSKDINTNDISVTSVNKFDALMEIKSESEGINVSITLENFGDYTEADLLNSILV